MIDGYRPFHFALLLFLRCGAREDEEGELEELDRRKGSMCRGGGTRGRGEGRGGEVGQWGAGKSSSEVGWNNLFDGPVGNKDEEGV
jgi:hypothetical protein